MAASALAVVPFTGEQVLRTAEDAKLLQVRDEIDAHIDECRSVKREIDAEVIRRMDSCASWTRHLASGETLNAQSPESAGQLRPDEVVTALGELVRDGVIDEAAAERVISTVLTVTLAPTPGQKVREWLEQQDPTKVRRVSASTKVNAGEVKRVMKVSEIARQRLEQCRVVDAPRSLTVKRPTSPVVKP